MRRSAKIFRRTTSDEQAENIIQRIKAIDYELMSIGNGGTSVGVTPLNARGADALARIQRELRILRIEMEVERGIDCPPATMAAPPDGTWPRPYRRRKGR